MGCHHRLRSTNFWNRVLFLSPSCLQFKRELTMDQNFKHYLPSVLSQFVSQLWVSMKNSIPSSRPGPQSLYNNSDNPSSKNVYIFWLQNPSKCVHFTQVSYIMPFLWQKLTSTLNWTWNTKHQLLYQVVPEKGLSLPLQADICIVVMVCVCWREGRLGRGSRLGKNRINSLYNSLNLQNVNWFTAHQVYI